MASVSAGPSVRVWSSSGVTASRTAPIPDRKSTRLNSSHSQISYAVFCLKKKKPPLTEERRKELVKVVHKFAEEGRVAIRHARTDTMNKIKKTEHVSSDDQQHAEKDVQQLHDEHLKGVDAAVKAKEAEIMEEIGRASC